MIQEKNVKLSVTELAAFACRTGDLISDGVAGPTALEGIKAHKKVQRLRAEACQKASWLASEVSVTTECELQNLHIILSGRIDLIDTRAPSLTEIKTTLVPALRIPESQKALQWAQIYLYGYMFWQQLEPKPDAMQKLELELLHFNIRDNSETSEVRQVPICELKAYALHALENYAHWINIIQALQKKLVDTADTLAFPYHQFRTGQWDMAAAVYRASRHSAQLMCEAPTGIGKTVSSLYPAIKSISAGGIQQLVYLTAKVAGRLSAEQAMRALVDHGLAVTVLQIRARDITCFCNKGQCERDDSGKCPMTLGFYDRLPAAREELLQLGLIDNIRLDEIAWAHQLCPYELARQLLPWVHVVIADFNYVFDPLVRLPHFSKSSLRSILLVDEAHNLVERSRAMYSAELSRSLCTRAAHECRQSHPAVERAIAALSRKLLAISKDVTGRSEIATSQPRGLAKLVSSTLEQINVVLTHPSQNVFGESTTELWRQLCRFAVISDLFAEQHRCILTRPQQKIRKHTQEVTVNLYCLDTSRALSSTYAQFKASIIFSATLRPAGFYRDALGLDEDIEHLQLASPFNRANCTHYIVDWIDTRYQKRTDSAHDLVSLIKKCIDLKKGKYIVYFPSYAYLEQIHELFHRTHPECATWAQFKGQSKLEQQAIIESLDANDHRVGFAITGGVFGEGIDLKGDRLIGAIIVGTGLPARSDERELIAQRYREAARDGYKFAYMYPAFTRVLQTAGRVIRQEADKGFVLLVDSRFKYAQYRDLFPEGWDLQTPQNLRELLSGLSDFWKKNQSDL